MIEARFHIPLGPGEDRNNTLENMLNVLAEANAVWLSQNPDAPCCPACAGVSYYDPPVGACQNFWGAPGVLRRGRASCADAAAYEAGVKLAEGHQAVVVIEPVDGISLHAVVYVDGERIDPSAELKDAPHRVRPRCDRPGTMSDLMSVGHFAPVAANDRGQRFAVAGPGPLLVAEPANGRDFLRGRQSSFAARAAIDRAHGEHQIFGGRL